MASTINMQEMRHINLFGKITKINTRYCFQYNNAVVFAVPKHLVFKAIGPAGKNVKKISSIIGKKVKVIAQPKNDEDIEKFLSDVVNPVEFKELKVEDDLITITAGNQNKAALIGRNKRRLLELQKIAKDFFNKDLKII